MAMTVEQATIDKITHEADRINQTFWERRGYKLRREEAIAVVFATKVEALEEQVRDLTDRLNAFINRR